MTETPVTLLDRLQSGPAEADWNTFHDLYAPLLQAWLARVPGLHDEADDVAQDVLSLVVREIARFERRGSGSFRAWLRTITVHRVRTYWKNRGRRPATGADEFLSQLEDPTSGLAGQWDRDHDKHVFDRVLAAVRPDFEPRTWEAFTRFALDGQPAARVAADLGVTVNAVTLAKARVLKRLRDEAGGLID